MVPRAPRGKAMPRASGWLTPAGSPATLDLTRDPAGAPLQDRFRHAFEYSDCWVDDARLVVLNARDAADHGAQVFTHTACESAQRVGDRWQARLRRADGSAIEVSASCLVNAAGPWAAQFLKDAVAKPTGKALRLVKGSHIVVKKMFDHPYAYIFQNPDGRIVFAIDYEQDFTLVGTTDLEYTGDTNHVAIDQSEIDYLCELTARYFRKPLQPSDVVWSYSGVRPLLDVMGRAVFHLGGLGCGHAMKCINNCITAITLANTAEGLVAGKRYGLDPKVMVDVLNESTGGSWITQTHFNQRVFNRAFDDPFKLELMLKDVGIAVELAREHRILVSIEDGVRSGGVGSAIADARSFSFQ